MKQKVSLPIQRHTRSKVSPELDPCSYIEKLYIPAAIYRDGQLYGANDALQKLFTPEELKTLNTEERIQQAIGEVAIIDNAVSFDVPLSGKVYRCAASPIQGQKDLVSLFFEDITTIAKHEEYNALLYRLTLLFSSTDRPIGELIQMAIDEILFDLQMFSCSVSMFDRVTGKFHPIAWGATDLTAHSKSSRVFRIGEKLAGSIALSLKPMVIPDIQNDPRCSDSTAAVSNPLSVLCLPLALDGQLFGIISITRRMEDGFTDKEVQFFTTVASRLALYINLDRTKQKERQENKFIQAINATTHLLDDPSVLVRSFAELLEVDSCLLVHYDSQANQFECFNMAGPVAIAKKELTRYRKVMEDSKTATKKWLIDDYKITRNQKRLTGGQCQRVIFPLIAQQKLSGFFMADTTRWCRVFTEIELSLGASLASQVAAAFNNAAFHEEVLEERNMMQQLLDGLRDGVILYTPDWKVAMYNKATRQLLGIRKDIAGEAWNEALNERAARYSTRRLIRHFDAREFFDQAIRFGKTSTGLATLTGKVPRTLEIATGPVYDRQNNVCGVLSHARDVTQVQELQGKMTRRVKQLTNLFKISSVSGFNVQQIVQRILKLLLELLDVRACQLLLINSDDSKLYIVESYGDKKLLEDLDVHLIKKIEAVTRDRKPYSSRIRLTRGRPSTDVLIVPIMGHHETCIGALLIADRNTPKTFSREDMNVLAIVAARIAMKIDNARLVSQVEHDREKLAAIIEQSADGIAVVDNETRIQIWNPALEKLTGLKEEEVKGKIVSEIQQELVAERGEEGSLEAQITNRKTGERIWLGATYAPIVTDGVSSGYAIMLRNISRQKELEKAKNEFVATASHELRSPLTAIVGYLSMMKRGDAGEVVNRQQAFFIDKAYQNAKRMVALVEDILTTTRMETGQLRYSIEPLNLCTIIETILGDLQFRAEEKNITIQLKNHVTANALADHDGVAQIFTNIITNAIKYTEAGGKVVIRFQHAQEQGKSMIVTSVQDTGVGIDTTDQAKVFDKFGRVDNPLSVAAGGTGLGLYITKTIVEQLGGKIWVESKKSKGSTFYISLPASGRPGKKGKK